MAGEADADLFSTFHTLGQLGQKYGVYGPFPIEEGPPTNSNLYLQLSSRSRVMKSMAVRMKSSQQFNTFNFILFRKYYLQFYIEKYQSRETVVSMTTKIIKCSFFFFKLFDMYQFN